MHNDPMEEGTHLDSHDYDRLMQTYLNICNQALSLNRDRFPFKQIFEAVKHLESGRRVEVEIQKHSQTYVIGIEDDEIVYEVYDTSTSYRCDGKWVVSDEYLLNVMKNPELYIQNPARLDWEWMYHQPYSAACKS